MNLTVKKYSKIVNLAKKNNFSIFEILTNYGLFSGDSNLFFACCYGVYMHL